MTEPAEVSIVIRRTRKWKTYRVISNPPVSCNLIEKAFVEALKRPWTRSDDGITYDFSDHASPPLGRCELDWGWEEGSATCTDTFIVVEEVKGTSCSVILGPADKRLPFNEPWNISILTFAMRKRSKGTLPSIHYSWEDR
jgi:hypothetical protein